MGPGIGPGVGTPFNSRAGDRRTCCFVAPGGDELSQGPLSSCFMRYGLSLIPLAATVR